MRMLLLLACNKLRLIVFAEAVDRLVIGFIQHAWEVLLAEDLFNSDCCRA